MAISKLSHCLFIDSEQLPLMPNYDEGAVVVRKVNGTYFLDVVVPGHIIIT